MAELFTGIEHIAISARSPEVLADFYVQTLGFKVVAAFDNGDGMPQTFMLGLGSGPMIEIIPADRLKFPREKQNADPGIVHLAISVSNFDQAAQKLNASSARPEGDERQGAHGARVRFYRDPEGNLFHILLRPKVLA
jgi:glyoxylase I family protein